MNNEESFSVRVKSFVYHHQLKSLREESGFTQQEVAERCGIPVSYYGEMELLKRFPTEQHAVAIADLFEVDPGELFPKWTMPAYFPAQKITDRVIEIQKISINASEVHLLASPPDLEENLDKKLMYEKLHDILESLTPRERRVLELRYGLGDRAEDGERTLEEVAREFGVTRERIRQIESKAIRKLRHPSLSRELRSMY